MKIDANKLLEEFLLYLNIVTDEELEAEINKAREDSKDSWLLGEEEDEIIY